MKHLSDKDIQRLSKLSRIHLDDSEVETFRDNISKILTYIEMLDEVNTDGRERRTLINRELSNVFRPDEVCETLDRDTFLDNAPDSVAGMIRTPPIMSEEGA